MRIFPLPTSTLQWVEDGTHFVKKVLRLDIDTTFTHMHRNPMSEARGDKPIISSKTEFLVICGEEGHIENMNYGTDFLMFRCARMVIDTEKSTTMYQFLPNGDITIEVEESEIKDAAIPAANESPPESLLMPGDNFNKKFGDDVLGRVQGEVQRAKNNWPPFNSAHEGFAILLEEVDELKAHVWTNQKRRDLAAMQEEAIQVAAMAIRFANEVCDESTGRK